MRFEGESKLQDMQDYYESAVMAAGEAHEEFARHRRQYEGDPTIDGSNEKASFVRNITYEIIGSVFTFCPSARAVAMVSEKSDTSLEIITLRVFRVKSATQISESFYVF